MQAKQMQQMQANSNDLGYFSVTGALNSYLTAVGVNVEGAGSKIAW